MELAAGMVEMPVKDSDIENADSKFYCELNEMPEIYVFLARSHDTTLLESHQSAHDDNQQRYATSSASPNER